MAKENKKVCNYVLSDYEYICNQNNSQYNYTTRVVTKDTEFEATNKDKIKISKGTIIYIQEDGKA